MIIIILTIMVILTIAQITIIITVIIILILQQIKIIIMIIRLILFSFYFLFSPLLYPTLFSFLINFYLISTHDLFLDLLPLLISPLTPLHYLYTTFTLPLHCSHLQFRRYRVTAIHNSYFIGFKLKNKKTKNRRKINDHEIKNEKNKFQEKLTNHPLA